MAEKRKHESEGAMGMGEYEMGEMMGQIKSGLNTMETCVSRLMADIDELKREIWMQKGRASLYGLISGGIIGAVIQIVMKVISKP